MLAIPQASVKWEVFEKPSALEKDVFANMSMTSKSFGINTVKYKILKNLTWEQTGSDYLLRF